MSWSIGFIGSPENISKALNENSGKLTGNSKQEYDNALPHIEALVNQNRNKTYGVVLQVTASGHGYKDVDQDYNNVMINIQTLGGQLV